MEYPNIKVAVKHSESKAAWNVIGTKPGGKYKIARVPYIVIEQSEETTDSNQLEALRHANFISYCFNNAEKILQNVEITELSESPLPILKNDGPIVFTPEQEAALDADFEGTIRKMQLDIAKNRGLR